MGRYDFILLGGGLASCLLALRLLEKHPHYSLLLLEKSEVLGGDHTWSFHTSDVSESALDWLRPFIKKSWSEHTVRFPAHERKIASGYHSIRSEDFHRVLQTKLGNCVQYGAEVTTATHCSVTLSDGKILEAKLVLDGRGFQKNSTPKGFQKFVGLDLELSRPHGLSGPILMDATIPQTDGFRFFYTLPWSETSLLVEDTYYSDTSTLDVENCKAEILRYAKRLGFEVKSIAKVEVGCLPIPLYPRKDYASNAIGVRAEFFHPTTGYSLPYAMGLADQISSVSHPTSREVQKQVKAFSVKVEKRNRFFYFLNRMLFLGAKPNERYRILERFYRLPETTVLRFYAARLKFIDTARILLGKPPIPVWNAVKCFFPKGEIAYG